MREIKFRAWDKENKFFWDDENVTTDFGDFRFFNDYILMQFTGFLDKNGKEIYEGDIINNSSNRISIIEYINGCFVTTNKTGMNGLELKHIDKPEVIGNIYENPELIK